MATHIIKCLVAHLERSLMLYSNWKIHICNIATREGGRHESTKLLGTPMNLQKYINQNADFKTWHNKDRCVKQTVVFFIIIFILRNPCWKEKICKSTSTYGCWNWRLQLITNKYEAEKKKVLEKMPPQAGTHFT